jgi:thiol-disulfide isomerase/thioredoxin
MKHYSFIVVLFLSLLSARGQNTIQGRIVNESGNPVANANVFIHNTQKGTISDINGNFLLNNIPKGQHELIISSIGYETNVFPFFEEQLPLTLKVEMAIKVRELENVTVSSEPYEEGGWEKFGTMFNSGFIGALSNAEKCKIKNKDALVFRFYKKSQRLRAFADEPLLIENQGLGYNINYQLEYFEMNMEKGSTSYMGYTMFTEMDGKNKNDEEKWNRKRLETYTGSLMHFMRSLYQDRFAEEGFDVRRIIKTPNLEKLRVKEIIGPTAVYKSLPNGARILQSIKDKPGIPRDTLYYYDRVLNAPDSFPIQGINLLTKDSMTTISPDGYTALQFPGEIAVNYIKSFDKNHEGHRVSSFISLAPGATVSVDDQGYFYDSRDLFVSGNWGYTERAANFLPQDYQPLEEKPQISVTSNPGQKNNPIPPIHFQLTHHSIVKDSTGTIFPFLLWQPMIASGNYTLLAIDSTDPNTAFLLYAITDKNKVKSLLSEMKPPESEYFKTGASFSPLKLTDIYGKPIDTKGKLLVLNYWFINCPPCKLEIPKLNELVFQYKENKDIIFVAIALDAAPALLNDQVTSPFKYQVVANGRKWADQYRIRSYPTHVIVNKQGKIVFHCTGYNNSIGYWLEKYIEENK